MATGFHPVHRSQVDAGHVRPTQPMSGPDRQKRRPIGGGVLRLGVATEIPAVLAELGSDPAPILQGAGLDPHLFEDGDHHIPYATLGRLMTLSAARTNCPHFGLLVGQRGSLSSLGVVGGLMQQSPTVGDALRSLVLHFRLHDRGAACTLEVSGQIATLAYSIYDPGVESADQISDEALAVAANVMRALCGPNWAPGEVLLPRQAPADPEPYRRHFQAPVRFDEEMAALVFPAAWLARRIIGADAFFRRMFERHIDELEAVPDGDFKDALRRVLRTRLLVGKCSADTVARLFAMHRRTLNRRLNAEGTAFKAVADEIRFEIARQLLADTTMPFGQIAATLDFSEASAFTRAFRRWSGQTPTSWRSAHRRAGDAVS